jgi:hypothetical protein
MGMLISHVVIAQETAIRGYGSVETKYDMDKDEQSFLFGEQDIFITSELSDKISFLGETVFKYSESSATKFNVSIERIQVKYNYIGKHHVLIGKHHTPVNYWNDSYHHGRLFFPTINRPIMFSAKLIPIHTTGVRLQGYNIFDINFGYDVVVGNGIGASEVMDYDKTKSVTAAIHIKPAQGIRIGGSMYYDRIAAGVTGPNGSTLTNPMDYTMFSGSVAAFRKKLEVLTEFSIVNCSVESDTGKTVNNNSGIFGYIGYRFNKLVPYFRYDMVDMDENTVYFKNINSSAITVGLRYEVSPLVVFKLEYEYDETENDDPSNHIYFQIAIGF